MVKRTALCGNFNFFCYNIYRRLSYLKQNKTMFFNKKVIPQESKVSALLVAEPTPKYSRFGFLLRFFNRKLSILVVFVLVLAGGLVFKNFQLQKNQKNLQEQLSLAKNKNQENVATSADAIKQDNQKLTDAVAKKAILFRPSTNKIIELAPLNLGAPSNTPPLPAPAPVAVSEKLTVEIRNGSGKSGAAGVLKTKLQAIGEFIVTKTGNANGEYAKTQLYVLDAKKASSAVARLREIMSAETAVSLPAGEIASSADALLILGKE